MLVGLIGYKRSGKDSVANILVQNAYFVREAFANGVRKLAEAVNPFVEFTNDPEGTEPAEYARYLDVIARFGYDVAKQFPDVRRLLQRIGTEGGRQVFGTDVWVRALEQRLPLISDSSHLAAVSGDIVVTDVRFPNEAAFIKTLGGALWRVNRPGTGLDGDSHESEAHVAAFEVDAEIDNSGDLNDLSESVAQAYQALVRRTRPGTLYPMTVKSGTRVENDLDVLTPGEKNPLDGIIGDATPAIDALVPDDDHHAVFAMEGEGGPASGPVEVVQ